MKISAKGRYGLAAMTYLARNYAAGTPITIVSISEKLGAPGSGVLATGF